MPMEDTQFKKGDRPWNKGVYGYMGANSTSYEEGHVPANRQFKGYVSVRDRKDKTPEVLINIDWKGERKMNNNFRWYLWESANKQDRPYGFVLAVRNDDPLDIRLDNLELISMAENLRRNSHRTN